MSGFNGTGPRGLGAGTGGGRGGCTVNGVANAAKIVGAVGGMGLGLGLGRRGRLGGFGRGLNYGRNFFGEGNGVDALKTRKALLEEELKAITEQLNKE